MSKDPGWGSLRLSHPDCTSDSETRGSFEGRYDYDDRSLVMELVVSWSGVSVLVWSDVPSDPVHQTRQGPSSFQNCVDRLQPVWQCRGERLSEGRDCDRGRCTGIGRRDDLIFDVFLSLVNTRETDRITDRISSLSHLYTTTVRLVNFENSFFHDYS